MARARAAAPSMLQMDGERLHDLQPDPEHRIERRHRLLEDHGDLPAADAPHLLVGQAAAIRGHRSGTEPLVMRAVPGGSSRITASAETDLPEPDLADDRHHLARTHDVAQVLHRPHGAVRGDELER